MDNEIVSIPIDDATERRIFDDLHDIFLKVDNTSIVSADINLLSGKFNYDNIINKLMEVKVL